MKRSSLLGVGAVVIVASALLLSAHPGHYTPPREPTPTPTVQHTDPVKTPIPSSMSGLPVHADSTGARHTTRQFLKEYLPFSYGNPPGDLNDASADFRAQLLADPPRAPASMAKTTTKVLLVQVEQIGQDYAATSAWVEDSHNRRYVVKLQLEKHGRWMVTGMS